MPKPKQQEKLEKLVLKNGTAELHLPNTAVRKLPTERIVDAVRYNSVYGMRKEAFPETVRWRIDCASLTVFILELKPALRWMRWISPKSPQPLGPEAVYEDFKLATPFIILKAPFKNGQLLPRCELFYRTSPVAGAGEDRGLDSRLLWPNLLNVSPDSYGCTAWFCTQYLDLDSVLVEELKELEKSGQSPGVPPEVPSMTGQLDALVTHIFGGGFNRSSDVHEGKSCFAKAAADKVDPRVTDVRRWQKASEKNPRFAVDVAWKPTGLTIGKLVKEELAASRLPLDVADTSELVNVLLAARQTKGA